jgi:hypothetical protein
VQDNASWTQLAVYLSCASLVFRLQSASVACCTFRPACVGNAEYLPNGVSVVQLGGAAQLGGACTASAHGAWLPEGTLGNADATQVSHSAEGRLLRATLRFTVGTV